MIGHVRGVLSTYGSDAITLIVLQPDMIYANLWVLRHYKHIAAIYVHFPYLSPEGSTPTLDTKDVQALNNSQHVVRQKDTLCALMHDICVLSQQLTSNDLIDQSASPPAILEAIRSAKYTLTVVITSAQGTSALSYKDHIAPNQKSWVETAKRMGVKWALKWKRQCLPKECGVIKQSIGTTKGKQHCHMLTGVCLSYPRW